MASDELSYPLDYLQERQAYVEQLEQQLAQAREDLKDERKWKERIKDEALHYLSEQERLKEENAQARALLERWIAQADCWPEVDATRPGVVDDTRAFLAEHPKEQP